MGRVAPGKSMLQLRRKSALERLIAHTKTHEEDKQLEKHKIEIERLKELVK